MRHGHRGAERRNILEGLAVLKRLASIYSAIFRLGGLLFAGLSILVAIPIGLDIVRDGHVLVDGLPDSSIGAILSAVGTPLLGAGFGIELFLLLPKIKFSDSASTKS